MEAWKVQYEQYDPDQINYRETILALGNTYVGLRGVEDEMPAGSKHGLYMAGVFNQSECLIPEIVNFPNFVTLRVEVDGEIASPETCTVHVYARELDMAQGTVNRTVELETPSGKRLRLESQRFLSFYDVHCGALALRITPLNFAGPVRVWTEFDGTVLSREGSYMYEEQVKHYALEQINDQFEDHFYARARVRDSGLAVDFASALVCEKSLYLGRGRRIYGERIEEWIDVETKKDSPTSVFKYFSMVDSRTVKEEALAEQALIKLERMKGYGFDEELRRSIEVLGGKWERMNVTIEGDEESDRALRFTIYQLLILGSETSARHGIGSKGLSTEHYGGHYFWCNEIYFQPLFLNTSPHIARNLLEFRRNTLERAKQRAREQGFEGSLWPWQSTASGEEGIRNIVSEDGVVHRRPILDQYHLVSGVVFGTFRYLYHTGDEYTFRSRFTPLVIEGLRFWKSFFLRQNDADADVYHVRNVMGPDEYHRHLDDNYYTNYLTRWVFDAFFKYYDSGSEKIQYDVRQINNLTEDEIDSWRAMASKIYLPPLRDDVIEQFEGYFDLRDLVITGYDERGLPLYPDASVGEGLPDAERQHALQSDATTTQLIKQADAIMLFILMPDDFDEQVVRATVDYYAKRTLHFSSLSPGNYAQVLALIKDPEPALDLFKMGANMDLKDIKNESETGPHTACQGATYQAAVTGFAGLRPTDQFLEVGPAMPAAWEAIEFFFIYKGLPMRVRVDHEQAELTMLSEGTLRVRVNGEIQEHVNDTGENRVIVIEYE